MDLTNDSSYPDYRSDQSGLPKQSSTVTMETVVEYLTKENSELKKELEDLKAEIKLWHDTLDGGDAHSVCHVMSLMEKVMRSNDE